MNGRSILVIPATRTQIRFDAALDLLKGRYSDVELVLKRETMERGFDLSTHLFDTLEQAVGHFLRWLDD